MDGRIFLKKILTKHDQKSKLYGGQSLKRPLGGHIVEVAVSIPAVPVPAGLVPAVAAGATSNADSCSASPSDSKQFYAQ